MQRLKSAERGGGRWELGMVIGNTDISEGSKDINKPEYNRRYS